LFFSGITYAWGSAAKFAKRVEKSVINLFSKQNEIRKHTVKAAFDRVFLC
jgi:hypothetical protein